MHGVIENAEKLIATAGELAETKLELIKLKASAKVSASLASILSMIIIIVLSACAVIILSVGLAYLLGQALENISYGFFIVGAVYALIGVLMYVNRENWIEQPLNDLLIDKITGNEK